MARVQIDRKIRNVRSDLEESVKANPEKFQEMVDKDAPEVKEAMNELSRRLDVIFNDTIREYCDVEGCEANIEDIPTYKTVNRLITGKIDELVKEHIKDKRTLSLPICCIASS